MKVKVLTFSPELLAELLRTDAILNAGIPSNAELVDLKLDLASNEVSAVFRTSNIDVENASKNETPCKALSRIGECTILESLKNKFAPQHRKLLTFEVESGILHARPVQALGSEWNEINDFVQNLGGRWIKDETGGYWEIFLL